MKLSRTWKFSVFACIVAIYYALWQMGQNNFNYLASGNRPIRTTSNMAGGAEYTLSLFSWEEDFEGVADRIEGQLISKGIKLTKRTLDERIWQGDGATIFLARGRQFEEGMTQKPSPNDRKWVILSIAIEHPPTLFYRLREKLFKNVCR
ncbi:MAG: hypothetical protein ABL949_11180 [Fimbriimonadaceae bacterium]